MMYLPEPSPESSPLTLTQVDMTDLLSVDEREDEQGPLGNVVSMGSILGKQGVQVANVTDVTDARGLTDATGVTVGSTLGKQGV